MSAIAMRGGRLVPIDRRVRARPGEVIVRDRRVFGDVDLAGFNQRASMLAFGGLCSASLTQIGRKFRLRTNQRGTLHLLELFLD